MHTARLRQDATAGVTAFSSLQRLLVQILRVLKWNASSILHPRIITPISARDYTHDAKANEQRRNGHLYEFWLGAAENLICFQINKKIGCLFKKQGIVIEWQPWYFNIDNIRMLYRHHGREVRKKRIQIHIHTYTMYIQEAGERESIVFQFNARLDIVHYVSSTNVCMYHVWFYLLPERLHSVVRMSLRGARRRR